MNHDTPECLPLPAARPTAAASRLACACVAAVLALAAADAGAAAQAYSDPALEHDLQQRIDEFAAEDKAHPPAPCQVLFVGSSSIVKWREHLAEDMAPLPVINRGFGGSHIQYVDRWFDEVVAPYRPRAIAFYAGENDIDAGKPVDRVLADFDEFMTLKARALGDTPVYFISVKPSKRRFAEFSAQTAVNDGIKERVRKRHDLHYIDIVPYMLEHGRPKDIFESDDLHMTREGYLLWKPVVREALMKNTDAEAQACQTRLNASH